MRKHALLISNIDDTMPELIAVITCCGTSGSGCISIHMSLLKSEELAKVKSQNIG